MPWIAGWKLGLAVLAGMGTLHAVWHAKRDEINLTLMRFFRDLGRYKALQRRMDGTDDDGASAASKGLLAFLSSDADPLQDLLDLNAETEDELHLPIYSRQELWNLGHHESEDGTLLLGILGRVYDVTDGGDRYYGPGAAYGIFAGRDVTYALATGCKTMACVTTDWTALETAATAAGSTATTEESSDKDTGTSPLAAVFTDEQLTEAKKWLSFFHLHDKYPVVGKLQGGGESLDALIQKLLEQDDDDDNEAESLGEDDMMKMNKDATTTTTTKSS